MKGRSIILDTYRGRRAAALMVDGELEDLLIDGDAPAPGTIYRARADRPVKGQGGMFLTTPDGPAFLRQVKGLAPGAPILVQVTGYAEPGKAIPVTQKLLFKSRYAIATPEAPGINISRAIRDEEERDRLLEIAHSVAPDGAGLILRSASAGARPDEVAEDIAEMLALANAISQDFAGDPERLVDGDDAQTLAWREWSEPAAIITEVGGFEQHGVLDDIEAALSPRVELPGGGYFYVETTRALVAVDVNTGIDTSLAAGIKANIATARALPRALRLRGLGGQVTIDLAPMPKKDRRTFETTLRAAFKSDPEETTLAGWTPLGHFELQRKRGRLPLEDMLS